MTALELAVSFHEAYERLAPSFGYETRPETRVFDPLSKNGKLMVAVCEQLLGDPDFVEHMEPLQESAEAKQARAWTQTLHALGRG